MCVDFLQTHRIRSPSESRTDPYNNRGTVPHPIRAIWAQHDRLGESQKKTTTAEL